MTNNSMIKMSTSTGNLRVGSHHRYVNDVGLLVTNGGLMQARTQLIAASFNIGVRYGHSYVIQMIHQISGLWAKRG